MSGSAFPNAETFFKMESYFQFATSCVDFSLFHELNDILIGIRGGRVLLRLEYAHQFCLQAFIT